VEVTVDSAGKLLCPQCKDDRISRTLSGEALKSATPSFSFGIAPTTLAPQADTRAGAKTPVAPPRVSGCSDCVSTHITIQRRDAQGKVEIYTAEWDNLTAASAPPEFVKLVNAIIALAK
jgi:hypothetical protein